MPLILPSAALLVVLNRPGLAGPPRQTPAQAESADKTKKKDKDKEKDQSAKAPKAPKEQKPEFRFEDHPSLHIAKGTHIDFKARVQRDVTRSDAVTADAGEFETVDLGRRNIGVEGEIANAVEFQIERNLTGTDPWRDVYAEFKYFPVARVRGGKFKLPFSLDENTSARNRDFVYRSLAATHLAPGRDIGVMVSGVVYKKLIEYEAGVFQHDGRNARTRNPDKVFGGQTTAGRVTYHALRNTKNTIGDLTIGAAFTQGDVPEGISGLRGQTVLEQNFFAGSDYIVNGPRRRTGIEFQFRPGPASIKAEWMRVETQRKGESVEDTDLSPIVGEGWYVSGSYALTGERKADGLYKPKRPLFPKMGFGAIEVAGRIESLKFRSGSASEQGSRSPRADTILGNRDQVTTVGVNWYVNRWVKIQANFIREKLDDPSLGPLPSKASFSSKAIRFMFSL
jgi:phosphate-selective porin OprO and OprP